MPQQPELITEILVPMDFSDCSKKALLFAKRVAAGSNARLHLLNVCDDPMLMADTTSQSFRDERTAAISAKFDELLDPASREQFRMITSVRIGTAYYEIDTYAEEQGIELIVMGNVGRSAIKDVLLGSVTSHVVREASCPVLTVK